MLVALLPASALAISLPWHGALRQAPLPTMHQALAVAPAARAPAVLMQGPTIDTDSATFYDEYKRADPETGEQQAISFAEKEKLYLECLDAFYNEGGKQIMPDDEYEALKTDLNFEGSVIATLSKDEIKFVLANKRYSMGKPILSDSEYDALRKRLKDIGSPVVLHEAPSCTIDGICKLDLQVDNAKQRLLYLPGTAGSVILLCELFFWTLHIDPFLSIILASVPSYFIGVWFTENIFAQKPLVTVAPCPECNVLNTVFFGDLFNVATDGIIPGGVPGDEVNLVCCNSACKAPLLADRKKMVLSTTVPKGQTVKA